MMWTRVTYQLPPSSGLGTKLLRNDCIDIQVRRLGGAVVSVLATIPKDCGFEPGQGDGFSRVIQIRSTPFRMGSEAGGRMS
jgi:hypothetical protein